MWKYFKQETGIPIYDNMLENPDYFKRIKHIKCKIISMTPDDFLEETARNEKITYLCQLKFLDVALVNNYTQRALAGSKMPLPSLEHRHNYLTHEGRHRALVAKQLNLKKMPVLIIEDMSDSEWASYMKKNHPKDYQKLQQYMT